MAGGGVCDFRVVGDYFGGVNVPYSGCGGRPAGPGGVYGTRNVRMSVGWADVMRSPGRSYPLPYLWSVIRVQAMPMG